MSWEWDRQDFLDGVPATVNTVRWRRGLVTFYAHRIFFDEDSSMIQWWIYVIGELGFGINLPTRISEGLWKKLHCPKTTLKHQVLPQWASFTRSQLLH